VSVGLESPGTTLGGLGRRRSGSQVSVIEPRASGFRGALVDVWRYRHLFWFFARRFVRKRYQRTWLGRIWLPLRPGLSLSSKAFVFGGIIGVSSGSVPYLVFFLIASSAWQLFAETAYWSMRSLQLSQGVLKRMYVPRLVPLVAGVAPALVDYAMYSTFAALALGFYWIRDGHLWIVLGWNTLYLPAGLALIVALGLVIGVWTANFAIQARDVRFGMMYVLSFWYFLTPVIYPLDHIPHRFRSLTNLNPVIAPVEMVKYGIMGNGEITPRGVQVAVAGVLVLGGLGLWVFGKLEARALDAL
jgi:lipopolysaccharide transport system permease protein